MLRRADRLKEASEAEAFLSRWVARDPAHLALRLRHAFSAHHAGRYDEALRRWNDIRARWPDTAIAWTGSASNLRELGRPHEGREIIVEALRRFPSDLVLISEAIRTCERLGDGATVLALSAEMMRLDPDQLQWRRDYFDRLLAANRLEEAAALLEVPAIESDPRLVFCRPLLALRRGDATAVIAMLSRITPAEAANGDLVAQVRRTAVERKLRHPNEAHLLLVHLDRLCPGNLSLQHHLADALIRAGRYDEAEAQIEQSLQISPNNDDLRHDRAYLALKTKRWEDAIAGFEDHLRRRPDHTEAWASLATARMERDLARMVAGDEERSLAPSILQTAPERQEVGLVEDESIRQLLLGFESVGQDCEFGLVQRRYGAEPLGLFRWNATSPELLTQASDAGFEGIGEPEYTTMLLWDDYEYFLRDRRWGFGFHTFCSRHEADFETLYATMCKRIAFLRRKLLRDLAGGEKIFVLKTFAATPDDVRAFFESLRRHGPVRLLWVRALTAMPIDGVDRHLGAVEEIGPGFYMSFVSDFGNRLGKPWQIAFDEWVVICRATMAVAADGSLSRCDSELV